MKRILAVFAALLCASTMAATLTPIQLLNPAGSTSGQVIASTGATSPPAWTTVTLSGLGGLAAANNLSDVASASAARANLGLGTAATANTGTSGAAVPLLNTANTWALAQAFTVRPTFNGNTPYDTGNLTIANYALTANPLSQFASTTSTQLAGVLSDETGTGVVVFNSNPSLTAPAITGGTINNATMGITTPLAAKFTTIQATSAITPSSTAGVVGTIAGDNANSGSFGEYLTANTSSVPLTAATAANAASLSLTAGDWDVSCVGYFVPAASTTQTSIQLGISTTSATQPGAFNQAALLTAALPAAAQQIIATPTVRQNLITTTTIYCVATANFAPSTESVSGFIRARRIR